MGNPIIDLTGQRFNRLLVLSLDMSPRKNGHARWLCLCDCGAHTIVAGQWLRRGHTKSCGCLIADVATEKNTKHGMIGTRPYRIWQNMSDRCRNPKNKDYHSYGARGILICEQWRDFSNFLADMGQPPDGHSLERRDNSKGYNPDNCYWATPKQQANNRRTNRNITYQGRTQNLSQWAAELGLRYITVCGRFRRGLSLDRVFSTKDMRYKDKPLYR